MNIKTQNHNWPQHALFDCPVCGEIYTIHGGEEDFEDETQVFDCHRCKRPLLLLKLVEIKYYTFIASAIEAKIKQQVKEKKGASDGNDT